MEIFVFSIQTYTPIFFQRCRQGEQGFRTSQNGIDGLFRTTERGWSRLGSTKVRNGKIRLIRNCQTFLFLTVFAIRLRQIGRIVGGTKGNPILEYVSGSPNKESVVDEAPHPLDYDELERYGYGRLATKIMKAGGRNAMYDLLGLERPPPPKRLKPKSAPKLVIDKTGETDQNRYTGLKVGSLYDDDAMAKALEEANRKAKEGAPLRKKIAEEEYIMPFAGM